MPEPTGEWLGAHLYFDGEIYSSACDRVVLGVVAPLVERLDLPFFFLRYRDDGSHVRLRFRASAEHLAREVRPAIEEAAAASPLVRRLEFVDYEPEIDRYGGPHGLALAEEIFHDSSRTALELLHKIDGRGASRSEAARSGKALLAMLVHWYLVAGTLPGDRRKNVADQAGEYARNYLGTQVPDDRIREEWLAVFEAGFDRQAERLAEAVEAAWEALEANEPLTPELDRHRERLAESTARLGRLGAEGRLVVGGEPCRDAVTIARWIVPSLLHMTNNRLGASIRDECYLAILVERALRAELTSRETA